MVAPFWAILKETRMEHHWIGFRHIAVLLYKTADITVSSEFRSHNGLLGGHNTSLHCFADQQGLYILPQQLECSEISSSGFHLSVSFLHSAESVRLVASQPNEPPAPMYKNASFSFVKRNKSSSRERVQSVFDIKRTDPFSIVFININNCTQRPKKHTYYQFTAGC